MTGHQWMKLGTGSVWWAACWAKWFVWVWRWWLEWEWAIVRCRWSKLLFVVWLAVVSGAWGFEVSRACPLYYGLSCETAILQTVCSIWVCLSVCLLVWGTVNCRLCIWNTYSCSTFWWLYLEGGILAKNYIMPFLYSLEEGNVCYKG